ncbi:hypothetical protein HJC23_009013 [Cyclotella cryptica]|uniref:Uncharacterized protein n=1 Tax=Cyclotella cryptica TaxID=29204 RepID=A0ABD3QZW7_9STRA|eukprot:CCRYP_000601-RF/>CCRYP_000601-RF protein AED:0.04 eAED:0.04 QI:692/1/1/1/0.75/0.61/21/1832/2028
MSFFKNTRSQSVPPNRRSQSFSIPNPKRNTDDPVTIDDGSINIKGESFHGQTEHERESHIGDHETIDDLNETIVNLKSSLMTHATSNAETMEHFNTLQKAHDKLYAEHMHLQEQMDDAVELLKYLKEEKSTNEAKIDDLQNELLRFKKMTEGSVVSMTIENLTKEKMELETSLENVKRIKEEAVLRAATLQSERNDFEEKAKSLEKFKEAYELQTRQTLTSGEKMASLEKEREELMEKVTELEDEVQRLKEENEDAAHKKEEIEKLNAKVLTLESELASSNDRAGLQEREIKRIKGDVENLEEELAAKELHATQQESEIARLENKVDDLEEELASNTGLVERKEMEIARLKNELDDLEGELTANNDRMGLQDREIRRLKNEVNDLEEELAAKNNQLANIDEELIREKDEMQSHLDNLQQQLIQYQEDAEYDNYHHSKEQHPSQSSMENPSQEQQRYEELQEENEELQYQIQQLEAQLQNERVKNQQEAEIHAQLEKEMQDRLTQRLAVHLQESEVAMEARIREELEEEYKNKMKQQHLQSKSKSFSASDAKGSQGVESSSTAFQRELEDQLRKQLQQVKEERERWQAEQEEFQNRVLLSKQQLDKIREGYRTKYDKEKKRANDLEKTNKDFQAVINALHQELNTTKEELDELHMHQSEQKLLLEGMSNQRSHRDWEKERKKFIEREKEYQAEVEELQIEVNELQGIDEECQRLEEEKADLAKKCKEIWEEHQTTLQEMEQLNSENEDLLKKIESLESAAVSMEEFHEKELEQCKHLECQLLELRQTYDEAIQMNNEFEKESAEKLKFACLDFECQKRQWSDEKALLEKAIDDAENNRSLLEAEKDELLLKLAEEKGTLEALQIEYSALQRQATEQDSQMHRLTSDLDILRSACDEQKAVMEQRHLEQLEVFISKDNELTEYIESLENEMKEAKLSVSKLTEEVVLTSAEKDKISLRLSEQIHSLEASKVLLESKANELLDRIKQLESNEQTLEGERGQLEMSLSNLQQLSSEQSCRIHSLEEENSMLQSSLNEVREEKISVEFEKNNIISEKSKRLQELESELDKIAFLEQEREQLLSKLESNNNLIHENARLTEEVNTLRSSLEKANNINEALASSSIGHERDKKAYQEKLASMRAEIDRLTEAISVLQTENESLNAQAASTTPYDRVNKEHEDKFAARDKEISRLTGEINALRSSLETTHVNESLISRSIEHNDDKQADEKNVASLEAEIDRLVKANAALQKESLKSETSSTAFTDLLNQECEDKLAMQNEICRLTEEVNTLRSSLEEADIRNEMLESRSIGHATDQETYEKKFLSLQAEIDKLKQENSALQTEYEFLKAETSSTSPTDELIRELADVNRALQRLHDEHRTLKSVLDDAKDTNVTLEEAIQDIQVEKEDLEAEHEELATKLSDLTTQAKMMLVRNEEMETQLSEAQNEYEERLNELNAVNEDLWNKLQSFSSDELLSLREKYDDALEIIQQLKSDECPAQLEQLNEDSLEKSSARQLKRLKEENLELREIVDHLTNENQAAMEIKSIVMELKYKNMELNESLRVSHEQKKAAADAIQSLKEENEKFRRQIMNGRSSTPDCENRVVPYQQNTLQTLGNTTTDELEYYKSIVNQLMSDRAVFTQRLVELMDINTNVGSARDMHFSIEGPPDRHDGMTAESNSRALVAANSYPNADEFGEQLRNLTIENGELAQRLGGAVAEKEFAMSTLSKLGAKLEELMKRNRLLENIANLKSAHAVEVGCRSNSIASLSDRLLGDEESKPQLRDPTGYGESENFSWTKQSLFDDHSEYHEAASVYSESIASKQIDDPSAYSGVSSNFRSFAAQKQLEPEESSEKVNVNDSAKHQLKCLAQDPTSMSDPRLIKVPGGEYYGQVNNNGQKHGRGKMIYDNGNEYEGTWVNNKRDGNGTTKYASGNMYVGSWKEGKRHGFGVFHIKKTGDVYRGNWERGLKSGPGVYEYADGEIDVSVYREDIRIGEGVRWNASRSKASRLVDGQLVGEEGGMPLKDATQLTQKLGFIL